MSDAIWDWQPASPAYSCQAVSLLRLDGADSRRVLHGQTTAAIATAEPGQWIATCCITATARMLALAVVLVDATGAWLAVTDGDGTQVHQALDRVLFPADQVRLGDPEPAWWLMPVNAAPRPAAGGAWQPLASDRGWQLGTALLVRDLEALPPPWQGLRRLQPTEQERWRLQQGRPAVPGEINGDHNPFELGLADRVSLSKGCYVGQETLAKLASYDGVKQQLRRWHWPATAGEQPPEAGDTLRDGNGGRLGQITSMLELDDGQRIGLALVRRQGLALHQLLAGEGATAARLAVSTPEWFLPPPVGAGAQSS